MPLKRLPPNSKAHALGYRPFIDERIRTHGAKGNTRAGCAITQCEVCGKQKVVAMDVLARTGNPGDCCGEMRAVLE